jgi:hypothetical protein
VQARLDAPGDPSRLEEVSVGWRNGHFVWSNASAETQSDGVYAISGLEPDAHTVRIAAVRRHDIAIDAVKIRRST